MIVFIATPASGGNLSCLYVNSLLETMRAFREAGWRTMPRFVPTGWTALARNELAGRFRESPADVLFYIDSDIGWRAEEALAVVQHASEVGIAGGHYPVKDLKWSKGLHAETPEDLREVVSREEWRHTIGGQQTSPHVQQPLAIRAEVDMLPTGFLAITREALETFKSKAPSHLEYLDFNYEAGKIVPRFEFFFYGKDEQNRITGEDVTFCRMARAMGMRLWKVLWLELQHEGKVVF
jgi:hypothetical protein